MDVKDGLQVFGLSSRTAALVELISYPASPGAPPAIPDRRRRPLLPNAKGLGTACAFAPTRRSAALGRSPFSSQAEGRAHLFHGVH